MLVERITQFSNQWVGCARWIVYCTRPACVAESKRIIDIAPAAIVRVLAAIVFVWLWLQLWQLLMVIVVALFVAIALEPLVAWLAAHRVPRTLAASGSVLLLTALIVGFFALAGSSLTEQASELSSHVSEVKQDVLDRLPGPVSRAVTRSNAPLDAAKIASYIVEAGRLIVGSAIVGILILILTVYLLIEGRQTYTWLAAYAPRAYRDRVHLTAREAEEAIRQYVIGNVATSVFATVVVFVALTLLHVPASLLLAVLAGIFDFVPVLGFICSALPALLLASSQGLATVLAVAAVYAGYHLVENYYVGPKVYGDRLRMSNLAVIVAFAVGAEIGGVVGALLALPIAALYPVVERVWLKDYLNRDAVETHRRLQQTSSH
jgi:predicted PurR-regulated permease PerM